MILSVAVLGPPIWTNIRMLAALAIACLVPLRHRAQAGGPPTPDRDQPPGGPNPDPPTAAESSGATVCWP